MKENKQRGQIKRVKRTERRKHTEGGEETEGESGAQASLIHFVFPCMLHMTSVSEGQLFSGLMNQRETDGIRSNVVVRALFPSFR